MEESEENSTRKTENHDLMIRFADTDNEYSIYSMPHEMSNRNAKLDKTLWYYFFLHFLNAPNWLFCLSHFCEMKNQTRLLQKPW